MASESQFPAEVPGRPLEVVISSSDNDATRRATLVVVPAYREATVIGTVVRELVSAGWPVVVVDDGSTDGTGAAAMRAGAIVLRHPVNLGQGAALRTGFAFALGRSGLRHVVTYDADGQHQPEDVARLVEPLVRGEADVVLGSRFLHAEAMQRIPPARRALLRLAVAIGRRTTGLPLTDTHNGLRAFRTEVVARLQLQQDRMAHASELLTEIARLRAVVLEVPADVRYTAYSLAKGQRLLDAATIVWDLAISRLR
jgi:glycosyltransferase involved in cell wall biosynthesis